MDPTTNPSAGLESSKRNGTTTHTLPSSDQHSPDVITETNSASEPAPDHSAKSGNARSEKMKKLFSFLLPWLAKVKGKGKEKEKKATTTTTPAAEDTPMAQGDAPEEPRATKKGGTTPRGLLKRIAAGSKK